MFTFRKTVPVNVQFEIRATESSAKPAHWSPWIPQVKKEQNIIILPNIYVFYLNQLRSACLCFIYSESIVHALNNVFLFFNNFTIICIYVIQFYL